MNQALKPEDLEEYLAKEKPASSSDEDTSNNEKDPPAELNAYQTTNKSYASVSSAIANTLQKPKVLFTEWQIMTHVKLTDDFMPVQKPYKESSSPYKFYCISNKEEDRIQAYNEMVAKYNAWRTEFNNLHGFATAVYKEINASDLAVPSAQGSPERSKVNVEIDNLIDFNDDSNFPSLGSKSNTMKKPNNHHPQKTKISSPDTIQIDPDEDDFVPTTIKSSKNNVEQTKPSSSTDIFDFDDSCSVWNKNQDQRKYEPNQKRATTPQIEEEKIPCPICNILYPMSTIENHASDCLSFEDAPDSTK